MPFKVSVRAVVADYRLVHTKKDTLIPILSTKHTRIILATAATPWVLRPLCCSCCCQLAIVSDNPKRDFPTLTFTGVDTDPVQVGL